MDVGSSNTPSVVASPTVFLSPNHSEHRLSVLTVCRHFDNGWICHSFCICGKHRTFMAKTEEEIANFFMRAIELKDCKRNFERVDL